MSNLVTFEQAKQLKELGFDNSNSFHFKGVKDGILINERLPTVSEALDWIREKNGIECGVYPIMIPIRDGLKRMAYAHSAFDLNNNCKRLQLDISLVKIDTHHIASSALLDAVLTYLEQKEKKE